MSLFATITIDIGGSDPPITRAAFCCFVVRTYPLRAIATWGFPKDWEPSCERQTASSRQIQSSCRFRCCSLL